MFTLIVAASWLTGASAIITAFPSNTVVVAGSKVILECRTNTSKKLIWQERLIATEKNLSFSQIFTGNKFSNNSAQKYDIVRESDGQFDLKFNATLDHGNEYMCQEPGGYNFTAQITVLASNPQCYVNGMPTTSNLTVVDEQEYIEFKCNLTFAGRWNPSMEWKQKINSGNDWEPLSSQEIIGKEGNIYVISATLAVNATKNITTYVCRVQFLESARPKRTTAENIPEYSYNWTSPTFVLRSFWETFNSSKQEKEQTGLSLLISASLMASAVLCVVVIIILKLRSSKAQQTITNNSFQSLAIVPMQPAANNTVGIQLDQPVIYSEVKKKTVKDQKVQTNNNQQEMKQPEIYSTVHKPDAKQVNISCSQQFSIQHENSYKVIGADGTEYSKLPVFQAKQPLLLKKAAKETFETSVYAQIDHTIAPPLPLRVQRLKTSREALKAK